MTYPDTYPATGHPAHDYAEYIRTYIDMLSDVSAELTNLDPDEWSETTCTYLDRDTEIDLTEPDLRHALDHDPCAEYLSRVLDVWTTVEARGDELHVTGVVALITIGGPRCELRYNGNTNGLVHVRCWADGKYAEVAADAPMMAEAMRFIWEAQADALEAKR